MFDLALEGRVLRENSWVHIGSTPVDLPLSITAYEHGGMHKRLRGKQAENSHLRAHLAEISPATTPCHRISSTRQLSPTFETGGAGFAKKA